MTSKFSGVPGDVRGPAESFAGRCLLVGAISRGAEVERHDFSEAAWEGPPPDAFSCWKSSVPLSDTPRQRLAPNDVMLELFERWESQPEKEEARYVLALLLVRRRVAADRGSGCRVGGGGPQRRGRV